MLAWRPLGDSLLVWANLKFRAALGVPVFALAMWRFTKLREDGIGLLCSPDAWVAAISKALDHLIRSSVAESGVSV